MNSLFENLQLMQEADNLKSVWLPMSFGKIEMRYATDEEKEEMGDEEDYAIIFGDELGSYIEVPEEHIINMVYDAFYNLSQDELLQLSNRDLYNLTNDITEEAFRRAPLRKNKLYELFAKYINI